jgi:hypothetical protein
VQCPICGWKLKRPFLHFAMDNPEPESQRQRNDGHVGQLYASFI